MGIFRLVGPQAKPQKTRAKNKGKGKNDLKRLLPNDCFPQGPGAGWNYIDRAVSRGITVLEDFGGFFALTSLGMRSAPTIFLPLPTPRHAPDDSGSRAFLTSLLCPPYLCRSHNLWPSLNYPREKEETSPGTQKYLHAVGARPSRLRLRRGIPLSAVNRVRLSFSIDLS